MSWSVVGIFVLLVTWGFTKSVLFGAILLLMSCALHIGMILFKKQSKYVVQSTQSQRPSRQEFFANEMKRLQDLRESGLLTEDEYTVQNRLLSCNRQKSYMQS